MNIIELHPDDAIVVTLVEQLTKEQRDDLVAQVRRDFGMRRVVALDSGSQITVVRRVAVTSQDIETEVALDANAGFDPWQDTPAGERTVQHVNTDTQDEEPAGVLPPHVWLYRNMLTDLQRAAPLGIDSTNGQYAVAVEDLTDDQRRIPHVEGQMLFGVDVNRLMKDNLQSDASS